jgi:hypothetical protein
MKMRVVLATTFGLFIAAAAWSILSSIVPLKNVIEFEAFVKLVIAVVSAFGLKQVMRQSARRRLEEKPFHLTPSFNSGLAGGFIGGALTGLFIGIGYYVQFSSSDKSLTLAVIPEIFFFGCVSGLFLGASIQLTISWFQHLAAENAYSAAAFNEISGGVLGGAVGGIFLGLLAILLFSSLHDEFVGIVPLATGTVFGVILVAAGALFYDYAGRWQNVAGAFLGSLLITVVAATAAVVALQLLDIESWLSATSIARQYQAGAISGVVIGAAAGLQVGLTLCWYRVAPFSKRA